MTTMTQTISEDARIVLEDRTAHALEETTRLERLLSKLGQGTAGSTSVDAKLEKSLAMARRAVGFTRAALEDMAAVLPRPTTVQRKNAATARRLAS